MDVEGWVGAGEGAIICLGEDDVLGCKDVRYWLERGRRTHAIGDVYNDPFLEKSHRHSL